MKELPKYAFLTNSVGFTGMKVIQLEHPYIIANVKEIGKSQTERINDLIDAMVQGRYPVAKVNGYTVFLTMFTSLEPCDDSFLQEAVLKDMAQFVLTERIMKKTGQFKGMKEE